MTVIVQQPTDSNGNPQPMVYDSDTGKIIVDSNGYVINGGKRLVNIPTKADYVNTPKTQTLGWQEAIDYAQTNKIGKITSKAKQLYILSNPVYFNPNGNYTFPLEIDGQNSTIQIYSSTTTLNPFQVNNNPNDNAGVAMYPLKIHGFIFDGNGNLSDYSFMDFNQYGYTGNNPDSMIEIYGNKFQNGSNGNIIVNNQVNTFSIHDNVFLNVGANGPILINTQTPNCGLFIYSNEFIAGALSAGSNAIGLNNNNTNTSITSTPQNAIITGNYFGNTSDAPTSNLSSIIIFGDPDGAGWNSAIIEGNVFNCNAGWQNIIEQIGTGGFNIAIINNVAPPGLTTALSDCLVANNIIVGGYGLYNNATIKNNWIYNPTSGVFGITINTGDSQNVVIDGNIINNNGTNNAIGFTSTSVTGSAYIIKGNVFEGSNNGVGPFPPGSLFYDNKTLTGNYPIEPTTPSVPTSATAQQNTNPYPVDVYIYGGTVTEIQITKNGTTYTVFSNSTGLALSGQAYKLNPGDSITVTYTAAPTWEWLSD